MFQTSKTFVYLQNTNVFLMKSETFRSLYWQSMQLPLSRPRKVVKTS